MAAPRPSLRLSPRMAPVMESLQRLLGAFVESNRRIEEAGPDACDFMAGNPQELAMPAYVEALQKWSEPERRDWFAYTMSEPRAQGVVAEYLQQQQGLAFEPEDV